MFTDLTDDADNTAGPNKTSMPPATAESLKTISPFCNTKINYCSNRELRRRQ
jgi:hypothetical protein